LSNNYFNKGLQDTKIVKTRLYSRLDFFRACAVTKKNTAEAVF
jgi:hypothetical protein